MSKAPKLTNLVYNDFKGIVNNPMANGKALEFSVMENLVNDRGTLKARGGLGTPIALCKTAAGVEFNPSRDGFYSETAAIWLLGGSDSGLYKVAEGSTPNAVNSLGGDIYRYGGSTFTRETPPSSFTAMAGFTLDSTHIYIGGASTLIMWNGSAWVNIAHGFTFPLWGIRGIWASAANDVWVVGDSYVLHWNGAAWSNIAPSATETYYNVWGLSSTDVWIGGKEGSGGTNYEKIWHYTGSFAAVSCPHTISGAYVSGIFGFSANEVYFTGGHSLASNLMKWDGATISTVGTAVAQLGHIWGSSGSNMFICDGTNIYKWNGSSLAVNTALGAGYQNYGIFGWSATDIWVVGYYSSGGATAGKIWKYDVATSKFISVTPPTTNILFVITGVSASDFVISGYITGIAWTVDYRIRTDAIDTYRYVVAGKLSGTVGAVKLDSAATVTNVTFSMAARQAFNRFNAICFSVDPITLYIRTFLGGVTDYIDVGGVDSYIIDCSTLMGNSDIIFFKKDGTIWRFPGQSSTSGTFYRVSENIGACLPYSVQKTNFGLIFSTQNGIYIYGGQQPSNLTPTFDYSSQLFSGIDTARLWEVGSGFNVKNQEYWITFPLAVGTWKTFVYSFKTNNLYTFNCAYFSGGSFFSKGDDFYLGCNAVTAPAPPDEQKPPALYKLNSSSVWEPGGTGFTCTLTSGWIDLPGERSEEFVINGCSITGKDWTSIQIEPEIDGNLPTPATYTLSGTNPDVNFLIPRCKKFRFTLIGNYTLNSEHYTNTASPELTEIGFRITIAREI